MDKTIVCFAKVSRRRNEAGDYVVKMYNCDGDRRKAADYYTDDLTDARQTARITNLNGKAYMLAHAPENLSVEV